MLVDALVADRAGAVFHQPAADLIEEFHRSCVSFSSINFTEIWLHLAWRTRGCFSFLRRLLLRPFEAIAPRADVAIQLTLDRRAMNAKLARYGGLREAALHEGVNLATFFVGQMVIAFGHMSSVRCGVPREDSLHLAGRGPACTTWKSVAAEKDGLKGARYVRIAAGDSAPLPRPFPQPLCSAMSSMHRCCTSELKRRGILPCCLLRPALAGAAESWLLAVSLGHLADERGPGHVEGAVDSPRFWPCIVL